MSFYDVVTKQWIVSFWVCLVVIIMDCGGFLTKQSIIMNCVETKQYSHQESNHKGGTF